MPSFFPCAELTGQLGLPISGGLSMAVPPHHGASPPAPLGPWLRWWCHYSCSSLFHDRRAASNSLVYPCRLRRTVVGIDRGKFPGAAPRQGVPNPVSVPLLFP